MNREDLRGWISSARHAAKTVLAALFHTAQTPTEGGA